MNVTLLKKKKKKKKSNNKKIHNFFHKLSWPTFTFFYLNPPLTSLFYLPLPIYSINKCEKFCQIFFVFRLINK